MNQNVLILTAASLGFFHTILGPDHYLPFIAVSKAKGWSLPKTLIITLICGTGHILGSLILGVIGVISGFALSKIEVIESFRGNIAAWLLIAFGIAYTIYGIRLGIKKKVHSHLHTHTDGTIHTHRHTHTDNHSHVHVENQKQSLTPWFLFIIFIFGPCECLIPVLMYPAAQDNFSILLLVTLVFGVTTIATMIVAVAVATYGFQSLRVKSLERYAHVIAGCTILVCGIAVQFLGL